MAAELRCPLCKKVLTQEEYDRALGTWQERRKAMARLQAELAKQRATMSQERKELAAEKAGLKRKVQEARATARAKAEQEFAEKSRALRARVEKEYSAKAAKALRDAEKSKAELSKVKASMRLQIDKTVASETGRLKREAMKQQKVIIAKVTKEVKVAERQRTLKLTASISARDLKIRELSGQVRELKRQMEQGTTPQIEGLLAEEKLLSELRTAYPHDRFTHTGKGGDIVHDVRLGDSSAGVIVYECKKVALFSGAHVTQARQAKDQRKADYAVLVTNARKKGRVGFFIESDVVVVHPAGVMSLVGLLRESLLAITRMGASREQKEEMVRRALKYLEGPEYRNQMTDTIRRTKELYQSLTTEVQEHVRVWKKRYDHYNAIHSNVAGVATRVEALLSGHAVEASAEKKALPEAPKFPPAPAVLDATEKAGR